MGLCPWRTVAPGLFYSISCLQQGTIRNVEKKKKLILFPIFRRMSLFPAFSTYMKCDDSNQVSLSSKLWICRECCSLPGLVITKATLLLCTIAITWPIEGPCLLGALSMYMSWCRCVLPTWYPCPWACPKLDIERGTCSRYLLPLPWALCLSLWSILSFSSMSCPSCFFCLFGFSPVSISLLTSDPPLAMT